MLKKHKKRAKHPKTIKKNLPKSGSQKTVPEASNVVLSMKQQKKALKPQKIKAEKEPDYTSGRALKIPVVQVFTPLDHKTLISREAYLREKSEAKGLNCWREFNSLEVSE